MGVPRETPAELRKRGVDALVQILGPVDMVRFLQQFEVGSGDYTRDREAWLKGTAVRDVTAKIRERREESV